MKTLIRKSTIVVLLFMSAMAINSQAQNTLIWGRQIGSDKNENIYHIGLEDVGLCGQM